MKLLTTLLLLITSVCVADNPQTNSSALSPLQTEISSKDIPCVMQGYFKGQGSQRVLKWHEGMTLKEAIQLAGGINEERTHAIMVDGRKLGWVYTFLLDEYKEKPELGSILIQRGWNVWAVSKHCYQVFTGQERPKGEPGNASH